MRTCPSRSAGFLADALHRIQQLLVGAGDAGQHLGVPAVGLAVVRVDGADLPWIGHQHPVTEVLEETARPRAVHSDFQDDDGSGMPTAQCGKAPAAVGDGFLFEDVTLRTQHAHGMLAVAEVESDGDGG